MSIFRPAPQADKTSRRNERGNVLIYILVAIALIAALSYAVSQSSRGSAEAMGEERRNLAASEILDYANVLLSATSQLKLRGCKPGEMNYANNFFGGYTNTDAPGDNSCDIFHVNGGGVEIKKPLNEWLDSGFSADALYGDLLFTAATCIDDVGSGSGGCDSAGVGAADLIFVMPFIKREICETLNAKLSVGTAGAAPPVDDGQAWSNTNTEFTGTFDGGVILQDAGNILDGKQAGCFQGDSNPAGGYHFYKVLLAR